MFIDEAGSTPFVMSRNVVYKLTEDGILCTSMHVAAIDGVSFLDTFEISHEDDTAANADCAMSRKNTCPKT